MISITGYAIQEILYRDASKALLRAERQADAKRVLLKIPFDKETFEQIEHERFIRSLFESEGVLAVYDKINVENMVFQELENFEGISLDVYLARTLPSFAASLTIACQLAHQLHVLHTYGILHRDIRPSNFLIHPDNLMIRLWDLRMATRIDQADIKADHTGLSDSNLHYISPEQSGRMTLGEDTRSDLYSLGITLYQLFTGKLPFEQTDINELVHAHMAKTPIHPLVHQQELPSVISEVILKLLEKKPEARYQSAYSLKADLQECCQQYHLYGDIQPFTVGLHELTGKFQLSTQIYGREEEIKKILAAFERTGNQSEFVLLHGNSGIGKSALMHEVHRRLRRKNTLFLSGKGEQHNQNIPFGIFIQAFRELIRTTLRDQGYLKSWRERIPPVMGTSIHILMDIIPELEAVLEKQPLLPTLSLADAQESMAVIFANFLKTVTIPERSLVIFLDDLQWADSASLNLLQMLVTSADNRHLLVAGTYRDTEIHPHHALVLTLQKIGITRSNFQHLRLSPLTSDELSELLADTLGSNISLTRPLANHLLACTLGNPLFIRELTGDLYKKKLITFDAATHRWNWSMEPIALHGGSLSSLDLITKKIQNLSRATQQTLVYAACIGHQFHLSMLAALMDKTDHETADELRGALLENLILPAPPLQSENTGTRLPKTRYVFFHDQVQQAACALMPVRELQELHINIGYFLVEQLSSEEIENRIFEIVNHFNFGHSLISDSYEKIKLARLNLKAGSKAKHSTAYRLAYDYFNTALMLLSQTDWAAEPDLCLSLRIHSAEAAYLTRDFEASDILIAQALEKTTTALASVPVYAVKIQSLIFQHRNKEAVAVALQLLQVLKITFPATPSTVNFLTRFIQCRWMLRGRKIEDLEHLPKMKDARILAAMRIMHSISAACYHAVPKVYPLLVLKMTYLSIKYGNTQESPLVYCTYGAIINAVETNNNACYRFGRVALALLQQFTDVGIHERTVLIYNLINRLSHEHLHGSLDVLKRCYNNGLAQGDLEYAGYTSNAYGMLLCISGKNLSWAKAEMLRCNMLPLAFRKDKDSHGNEALIQFVANLLNENETAQSLTGRYFNESTGFPEILQGSEPSKLFTCYVLKMKLCYLLGYDEEGMCNLVNAKKYLESSRGMVLEPFFYYYGALLNFLQYGRTAASTHLRQGKFYTRKLKKWAEQVPVNYAHRYLLAEAEYERVAGRKDKALDLYDKAIQHAAQNNYPQDEALGHELAARCWADRGQKQYARIYLTSAIDAYKKWGCTLKVKQLEETLKKNSLAAGMPTGSEHHAFSGINPSLDMATILKASTALSSEVVFDRLLEKLMKFVIENAGAQAGYFILDWGGKLYIEARQSVSDEKILRLQIPLQESLLIPKSIVEHALRSRKDVVLSDAQLDNAFSTDEIVIKNKVRSALCTPVVNQGKLVGALYLENNLTSGVFTKDRVELLKLLSGQIAVSIENSILYENLEQKVMERTAEIQVQKEEIERQKQLIEQKSKFKEQFFANMSHEIRTPMTAIIGMAELIFDTPLSTKQAEYANGIKYSSENLLAIINDILDFSKIEAGKFSFVQKPFQLRERMNRLNAMVQVLAAEKHVVLTHEIESNIPEQLIGDPLRLHQVLLNLVSNAIKFTEHGNVWVMVKQVDVNESHVVLSFSVRDSGIGIAADKLNFIFETFSRIEDELNVQHTGTGLGLFIAKKLVEEQGGSMTVSSKLKEGTTFQFTLPFQRCHDAPREEGSYDDTTLSGVRVLLVEDTLFNQVVAEEILKKIIRNATVIVAENGQVALEKLEQHTFDIVLMDIKMPVMDGYTASRKIRALPKLASIPILAFTSNANPGEAEKCREAGMDDYTTKPIESKKLKEKIAKLLASVHNAGGPSR